MKRLITICLLTFSMLTTLAQSPLAPQENFVLDSEFSPNQSYEYIARDFIKLDPGTGSGQQGDEGFQYAPQSGYSFNAKTNPMLIFPPQEGEHGGPNAGDNGVVGTIQGSLSVSSNGAAMYNIPITIPKGVNGFSPDLALIYSSNGKNNILGKGWNLSGISSISRTKPSQYYNGKSDEIDFDGDQLVLDGKKLISFDTIGDMIYFKTEQDEISEIIYHANDLPYDYFEIHTKSGLIKTYGKDLSRQVEQNDMIPFIWYIDKISDRKGNYIEFDYLPVYNSGSIRLDKIAYTGFDEKGVKLQGSFTIEFNYNNLGSAMIQSSYYSYFEDENFTYKNTLQLDNILVLRGDKVIKSYDLQYKNPYKMIDTFLEKVILIGEDFADTLNPTTFDYHIYSPECVLDTSFFYPWESGPLIPVGETLPIHSCSGDFNGDGKSDIAESNRYDTTLVTIKSPTNSILNLTISAPNHLSLISQDFNGDGIDELIIQGEESFVVYRIYYDSENQTYNYELIISEDGDFLLNDFNGDGIMDIVSAYDGNNWKLRFGIAYSDSYFTAPITQIGFAQNLKDHITMDVDGNGLGELIVTIDETKHIIELDLGDSQFKDKLINVDIHNNLLVGDFNGDGKSDFMNKFSKKIKFSKGNSFTDWMSSNIPSDIDADLISIVDLNNDGRSDVFVTYFEKGYDEYLTLFVKKFLAYPSGKGFSHNTNSFSYKGMFPIPQGIAVGDFLGDGSVDVYCPVNDVDNFSPEYSIYKSIFILDNDSAYDGIVEITDGIGKKTEIEYQNFVDGQDNAIEISEYNFPILSGNKSNSFVVSKTKFDNGVGSFYGDVNYSYKNPLYHVYGKGFLGFEQIKKENHIQGIYTISYNSISNPYYVLQRDSIKTFSISGNVLLKSKYNQFLYNAGITDLVYQKSISKSLEKIYELNGNLISTTRSEYTYNQYGNILNHKKLTDKNNYSFETSSNLFDYRRNLNIEYYDSDPNYQHFLDNWVVSLPRSIEENSKSPDDEVGRNTHTKIVYYDNPQEFNYGLVDSILYEPQHQNAIYKKTCYDDFGNISRRITGSLKNTNIETRETRYYYDHNVPVKIGRHLTRVTNILGENDSLFVEMKYNPDLGNIIESTDINGLITKYYYDHFGNLTKTVLPDGINNVEVKRWVQADDPYLKSNTVYYSWENTSGNSSKKSYYDINNKVVRTIEKNFNNKEVCIDYSYSHLTGKKLSITNPYFFEENGQQTTPYQTIFEYDEINRMTSKTLPFSDQQNVEKKYEYTYNGLEKTITNPLGETKKVSTNTVGWTKEIIDENHKSIVYQYFGDGSLKQLLDPTNTPTIFEYDVFGNKVKIIDPSHGTIENFYSVYGQINKIVKNGSVVLDSAIYDRVGRMILKEQPEGVTTVNYDTEQYGKGKIANVCLEYKDCNDSITSFIQSYYYDTLSRVIKQIEEIKDETYALSYTYNIFNNISSLKYPDEYKIRYKYKKGILWRLLDDNGKILWELEKADPRNKIEKYHLGDEITSLFQYDEATGKVRKIASSKNSKGLFQNMVYDWDKNDNLLYRKNFIYNLTENFTYDDLNRLTEIKLNNITTAQYAYDDIGNIISNIEENVHDYNYTYGAGNAGHQAITEITGNIDDIEKQNQNVSYTSFDKVCKIVQGDSLLNIVYGIDQQRKIQTINTGISTKRKTYIGGGIYEKIEETGEATKYLHYISGSNGIIAIYTKEENNQDELNYILKDHLGSIQYVTDESGNVLEERSYDAWGNERNPVTWNKSLTPQTFMFDRGFTMHEHLSTFGLINMNGRFYDPKIARFLSADPMTASISDLQKLNRYSYVSNNPLRYFDPTGFWEENWEEEAEERMQKMIDATEPQSWEEWHRNPYSVRSSDRGDQGGNIGLTSVNMEDIYKETLKLMNELGVESIKVDVGSSSEGNISVSFEWTEVEADPLSSFGEAIAIHSMTRVFDPSGFSFETVGGFLSKHINGSAGLIGAAVGGYDKIPNSFLRHHADKLSKLIPVKSGRIFQGARNFVKGAGKIGKKMGPIGTLLTIGVSVYEIQTDTWDAHTVVNGLLLLGAGAASFVGAPAVLTGIAIYGVGDYFFNFSDGIDTSFGRNSGIYKPFY